MKTRVKFVEISAYLVLLLFFTACGTTLKYNVQSTPAGALATVHEKEGDLSQWPDIKG